MSLQGTSWILKVIGSFERTSRFDLQRQRGELTQGSSNDRRFVGLDLASAPQRTGVALIVVRARGTERRARATLAGENFVASDEALIDLVTNDDVVGLDAPLGWPVDFLQAITAHHAGDRWPDVAEGDERRRDSLRFRRTDLYVRRLELGSSPLSVSSDLIGVVAMRAALLQSAWTHSQTRAEPRDGTGRVVETYPAAALRQWRFLEPRGVRYKGGAKKSREGEESVRRSMLNEIAARSETWLEIDPALRDAALRSDHVFDAVICALVALAAKAGLTHRPPPEEREAARREGWIHVPTGEFEDLAEAMRGSTW